MADVTRNRRRAFPFLAAAVAYGVGYLITDDPVSAAVMAAGLAILAAAVVLPGMVWDLTRRIRHLESTNVPDPTRYATKGEMATLGMQLNADLSIVHSRMGDIENSMPVPIRPIPRQSKRRAS